MTESKSHSNLPYSEAAGSRGGATEALTNATGATEQQTRSHQRGGSESSASSSSSSSTSTSALYMPSTSDQKLSSNRNNNDDLVSTADVVKSNDPSKNVGTPASSAVEDAITRAAGDISGVSAGAGSEAGEGTGSALPYEDAGLPVRKQPEVVPTRSKRKSRVRLGAKLMKLRKKRDMKYHQILRDEEHGGKYVGRTSSQQGGIHYRGQPNPNDASGASSSGLREQGLEALTSEGNSLPNLAPGRKHKNRFVQWWKFYWVGNEKEKAEKEHLEAAAAAATGNQNDRKNDGNDYDEDDLATAQCSRYVCYLLVFFFILALVIIFIGARAPIHHAPTYAPEPTRPPSMMHDGDNDPSGHGDYTVWQWKIHERLSFISSKDIDTPGTAQYKAAQWMLHQDEMGYNSDSPYLYQRFVLAIFYFKMEGTPCFDLNESVDECTWDKTGCNTDGFVTKLSLANCNVGGVIPTEIPWGFDLLELLDLSGNKLVGTIPVELDLLKRLESLYLDGNENLEGEVPSLLCVRKEKGYLVHFTVQCSGDDSKIDCSCCDHCDGQEGRPDVTVPTDDFFDDELDQEQSAVLSKLKTLSGNLVTKHGTPQYKAARWIIKDDDEQVPAKSKFLFQRYVLAMLHFMMKNGGAKMMESDGPSDECYWDGVSCYEDGNVSSIKFDHKGITGNIPLELKILHGLKYLDLSWNKLTGEIPPGLSLLKDLELLNLEQNDLSGTVPEELCAKHDLITGSLLRLYTDCDTNGKVECACCDSCNLKELNANQQEIWDRLKFLSGNAISNPDSPQYKAAYWIIWENKFHYPAHSKFLYQRYILVIMYYMMGEGSWFQPKVDTDECQWEKVSCSSENYIETIKFDNCDMSGSIPKELKALHDLKIIDFSSNNLSGEVPYELSLLDGLEMIFLGSNRLSGSIPNQLCAKVDDGNLKTIQIDCGRESDITCADSCCVCNENSPLNPENSWDYNQKATWTTLKTLSGDIISNLYSPQYNAAHWIIETDNWKNSASSNFLYQRYVLVLMYFTMGKDSPFRPDSEKNECLWERVMCNENNYIVHIEFGGCGMSGSIPKELKALHDLEYLDLRSNELSGEIPSELGLMMELETLLLDSNNLKGALPEKICTQRGSGKLVNISSDCKEGTQHKVQCNCCFNCPSGQSQVKVSCPDININMVTDSAASETRERNIRDRCNAISGDDAVCQHNSPQELATRWMISDDKMKLDVFSQAFTQRYAMAVAYFSLGPGGWMDPFWLSPIEHECEISGISCDLEKRITAINFVGRGMIGALPQEISVLTDLVSINIMNNEIIGNIPSSWSSLQKLESIVLTYNDMSGSVPDSICSLQNQNSMPVRIDCPKMSCSCCGCDDTKKPGVDEDEARAIAIKTKLEEISFPLIGEAQVKALNWITNIDRLKLEADSPHLVHRYILVLFYYALGGENWTVEEREILWLSQLSHCYWVGITCTTNGYVMGIEMESRNLKGQLPYELGKISTLKDIILNNNELTGNIPVELGNLEHLEQLYLFENDITGDLPDDKGVCTLIPLKSLDVLWVDCDKVNCPSFPSICCTKCGKEGIDPVKISGPDTSTDNNTSSGGGGESGESGEITEVDKELRAQQIQLRLEDISFPITTSQTRLSALEWITDSDPMKLPADAPLLVDRYILTLFYYALDGENWLIEEGETMWLTELSHCYWVGVTCKIGGDNDVMSIDLESRNLKGRLPYEIGKMSSLKLLILNDNALTGTIPVEFGKLDNLVNLYLYNNDMDGDLIDDKGVCVLRTPNQALSELWVDCDKLKCPPSPSTCCTKCGKDGTAPELSPGPPNTGGDSESSGPTTGDGSTITTGDGSTGTGTNVDTLGEELRAKAIKIKIEEVSSQIVGEARENALYWITNNDPMKLNAYSPNLLKRYILALLYYALDGYNWDVKQEEIHWLNALSHCYWVGITCTYDGDVSSIELESRNLKGELPYEIGKFSKLRILDFEDNALTGDIPDEVSELDELIYLNVFHNDMSGELFANNGVCALEKLGEFWLDCDKFTCPSNCCPNCN